jgi:hypothetical protein
MRGRALLACLAVASCQASTTRPTFGPLPEVATAQVRLEVPQATRALAEQLRADSIPLRRVVERDGVVESDWFSVPGYATAADRPLGTGVVMVRGWVDVGKAGHSVYSVETVYRVFADPSRPDRELEATVPADHAAALKVRAGVLALLLKHGDPDDIKTDSVALTPRPARDATRARPDTARAPVDTTRSRPDTTRTRPDTNQADRPRSIS